MKKLIYGLLALLVIGHQDFWWRDDHRTLVLGFLPISLAYHAAISVAATILWGLACVYCWPRDVDEPDEVARAPAAHPPGGH